MEPIRKMYITNGLDIEYTTDEARVTFKNQALLDEACLRDLKKQLFDLADKKPGLGMRLNFSDVSFMSSSCLGLLVTLDKHLRDTDRTLTLCNIKPQILKVFEMTKLDKIFKIC
jgi:anti-sigma B factor antagonist